MQGKMRKVDLSQYVTCDRNSFISVEEIPIIVPIPKNSNPYCGLRPWRMEMKSALCLLNSKKHFDPVPHAPLLSKLNAVGLDTHIVKWLCNYLANRTQAVYLSMAQNLIQLLYSQLFHRVQFWDYSFLYNI